MTSHVETFIAILAVISPFLLAALAAIAWLYRHERDRREAVERQLSDRKYGTYIALISIFFDIMKSVKAGRTVDQEDLIDRMFEANKDLMIYGSDQVLLTYQNWLASARSGTAALVQFADIIIAIRKDMGNSRTEVTRDDIMRQLIIDYDDAREKGLL